MTAGWSAFFVMACGFICLAWCGFKMAKRADEVVAANEDLRERLSTVTGQLADARERLALRVNRAHEGACKAAKTRKALRIKLPDESARELVRAMDIELRGVAK